MPKFTPKIKRWVLQIMKKLCLSTNLYHCLGCFRLITFTLNVSLFCIFLSTHLLHIYVNVWDKVIKTANMKKKVQFINYFVCFPPPILTSCSISLQRKASSEPTYHEIMDRKYLTPSRQQREWTLQNLFSNKYLKDQPLHTRQDSTSNNSEIWYFYRQLIHQN